MPIGGEFGRVAKLVDANDGDLPSLNKKGTFSVKVMQAKAKPTQVRILPLPQNNNYILCHKTTAHLVGKNIKRILNY